MYRLLVVLILFLVYGGSQPVWVWGNPMLSLFNTCLITVLLFAVPYSIGFNRQKAHFVLMLMLLYGLFMSPFRVYDSIEWFDVMFFMAILLVFFFKEEVHIKVADSLLKVSALIGVASLFVFILNILGVDPFYFKYYVDFRHDSAEYYKIYAVPVLALSSQSWDGVWLFQRLSGLHREPGHYGMLVASILVLSGMEFRRIRDWLILAGGCLTLSTAFYLWLALFLFLRFHRNMRELFMVLILFGLFGYALVIILPEELYYRVVGQWLDVLSLGGTIIDSRGSIEYWDLFQHYPITDQLLGLGVKVLEYMGQDSGSGDLRWLIVTKGYLLVMFLIIFLIHLARSLKNKSVQYAFISFLVVILAHRAFLLLHWWYVYFIFLLWLCYAKSRPLTQIGSLWKLSEKKC